jgi:hypothetical protein
MRTLLETMVVDVGFQDVVATRSRRWRTVLFPVAGPLLQR